MKAAHCRGIISDHFRAVGTVTPEMVRQRAREIAIINGHPANHCTSQDLLEAKRELTGFLPGLDDEEGSKFSAGAWGVEPDSDGRAVEKEEIPDEQSVGEVLIEQGINEAEHDQMVQAAKLRRVLG